MRPVGEARMAIDAAARELAAQRVGATWRELAQRAGVGYKVAYFTVQNMVRDGQLQRIGTATPPGESQRCGLYAPATVPNGAAVLDAVMRDWPRR